MTATESAPGLVPELLVDSLEGSVDFWCRLCGFEVLYDRPEEEFVYITRGTAHLMLEQAGVGRNWAPAALKRPLGRGVNFQISVASIDPLVDALRAADWTFFMEPETKWYRTGTSEAGVVQFLVQDPDGYLIRFQSSLVQCSNLSDGDKTVKLLDGNKTVEYNEGNKTVRKGLPWPHAEK